MSKLARENRLKTKQRKERINNFKKSGGVIANSTIELEFKEVPKEKLSEIRQRHLKQLKKECLKNILIIIISLFISIPLFVYLFTTFFNHIKL